MSPPRTHPLSSSIMHTSIATLAAFVTAFAATFGSSIAIGAQNVITTRFHIASFYGVWIVSLYLVGSSIGPFLFAPLGEMFGRRYALAVGVSLMLVFAAATAAAPNWNALLVFRFFAGLGASAPMSVSAGILADVFPNSATRGYVMSCLMAVTTLGSTVSSVISLQIMGRWPENSSLCFWVYTAVSGFAWLTILVMPETNPRSSMTSHAHHGYSTSTSLQKLLLPFRMALFEPIVLFVCLFLSLEYSIFYLFFQLIPKLYTEAGYVGAKHLGISFVPLAAGTIVACVGYILVDPLLVTAAATKTQTSTRPERRRLPPAYLGGCLIVLSLFLMGYCLGRRVDFIYPLILQGVFGCGFLLIFIGLTNYVVDSYQRLASSALASSFFVRNMMGAGLPFVAKPLETGLKGKWSFYLLGFLSLPLALIACGLHLYGPWLRRRSPLCHVSPEGQQDITREC